MPPPTFGSMRSRFSLRFFSWARRKQKRPAFYLCLEDNLSPGALQALKDPLVRDGLSYPIGKDSELAFQYLVTAFRNKDRQNWYNTGTKLVRS